MIPDRKLREQLDHIPGRVDYRDSDARSDHPDRSECLGAADPFRTANGASFFRRSTECRNNKRPADPSRIPVSNPARGYRRRPARPGHAACPGTGDVPVAGPPKSKGEYAPA